MFPGLNGRPLQLFVDTVPLTAGGFATIVAPRVKVAFSEIRLVDFAESEDVALEALSAKYREDAENAE